jgi:hypothetical protein
MACQGQSLLQKFVNYGQKSLIILGKDLKSFIIIFSIINILNCLKLKDLTGFAERENDP